MKLKELLIENGPQRVLYHFTELDNLYLILKDGYLKTKKYQSGTKGYFDVCRVPVTGSAQKEVQDKELCVIRKSMVGLIKKIAIGNPDAKFTFQIDKMRDLVRGIKVKPIAEYPLDTYKSVAKTLRTYGEIKIQPKQAMRLAQKIIQDIDNFQSIKKRVAKRGKFFNDILQKYGKAAITEIRWNLKPFRKYIVAREGEERLVGIDKIPLNSKYMTIEIMRAPNTYLISKYENKEEILKNLKKHSSLFVKNKNYIALKRVLEGVSFD